MLIVIMLCAAAALIVSGAAVAFGPGPALIVAGVLLGLAAYDLTRPRPGGSL